LTTQTGRAIFVVVLYLLFLPACETVSTQSPATATSPSQEKYILRAGYKAGPTMLLTLEAHAREQKPLDGGEPDVNVYVYTMYIPLELSADDAGTLRATMTLRRIVAKHERAGQSHEADSDKPETVPGGDVAEMFPLLGARFHALLDEAATVQSIALDRSSLGGAYFEDLSPEARAEVIDEACVTAAALLRSPWAYLPPGPVRVGESWAIEGITYAAASLMNVAIGFGPIDLPREIMRGTLTSVERTEHGLIATIAVTGRWEMSEKMKREQHVADADITGTIRLNLDTGDLLEHVIHAAGQTNATHDTITTTLSR